MASGGDLNSQFKKFATKGTNNSEATTKDITRWFTDAGVFGKACTSNNLDIAFSKVKPKGKNTITAAELGPLIDEIAKKYGEDKKIDEAAAKAEIRTKLAATEPKSHGATKVSATGGVDRMTDTAGYTGAHKERFDADGKGKGAAGRTDKAENTGYTGQYKGKDTYDKGK